MSRLIDADWLKEKIERTYINGIKLSSVNSVIIKIVSDLIGDAPTIDAVSVVRCKECKHGKYEFTDNKDWIYCKHHYDYWTADDFCSYGEKETDHE